MKQRILGLVVAVSVLAIGGCAQPGPSSGDLLGGTTTSCTYRVSGQSAKAVEPPPKTNVSTVGTVTVAMTMGGEPVVLTLDRSKAPCTVNSFESLAKQGFFTGSSCHRLGTQGLLMLQCGDPTATGMGGPGYSFDDELEHTKGYPAGTVAMANSGPDTNGSQFFLVYGDTPLPPRYTVFGSMDAASTQVVSDMAFQGHDDRYGDGTGFPHADTTISEVTVG